MTLCPLEIEFLFVISFHYSYSYDIQDLLSDAIECEQWPSSAERRLPTTLPTVSSIVVDNKNSSIEIGFVSSGMRTAITVSSLLLGVILSYNLT